MSNPAGLISAVTYRDPKAALAWLEAAFGFELVFLIEGEDVSVAHAEMSHGASRVMIGGEWSPAHASPASMGGKTTQTIHVYIEGDVDAHCQTAAAAGAEIVEPPTTQFYGARTYRCRDLEGHLWTVSADVETVSVEEMEKRSGLKITVAKT
ncbi:VOC family protein [Caulobacter sp. BP25]|uniref:VOC family protein n=1 Tax=Caulobacter sp. BP25 TaxID=2048900 RepID=UPI000C12CAC9|nr:VOC family protein [Caulobacter sp. BP25]PHY22142.1 glyoxalase [Caulobacter sp. BP25]